MKYLFLLAPLLIAACSLTPPTHRPTYTPQELAMIQDCREWVQDIEANSNAQLGTVPTNQKAFVLMHKDTMGMIESVWGKRVDICQPEDPYAVAYQAYADGQKEIMVTALKEAGASARAIAYVYGAVEISDNFGSKDSSQHTDNSVHDNPVSTTEAAEM